MESGGRPFEPALVSLKDIYLPLYYPRQRGRPWTAARKLDARARMRGWRRGDNGGPADAASQSDVKTEADVREMKQRALALKKAGRPSEAVALMREAKEAEAQIARDVVGDDHFAGADGALIDFAALSKLGIVDESSLHMTDADFHDPSLLADLHAVLGSDASPPAETAKPAAAQAAPVSAEVRAMKQRALALRKAGRTREALDVLREAKGIEAASRRDHAAGSDTQPGNGPQGATESEEGGQDVLNIDFEKIEKLGIIDESSIEMTDEDMLDPSLLSELSSLGIVLPQPETSAPPTPCPEESEPPAHVPEVPAPPTPPGPEPAEPPAPEPPALTTPPAPPAPTAPPAPPAPDAEVSTSLASEPETCATVTPSPDATTAPPTPVSEPESPASPESAAAAPPAPAQDAVMTKAREMKRAAIALRNAGQTREAMELLREAKALEASAKDATTAEASSPAPEVPTPTASPPPSQTAQAEMATGHASDGDDGLSDVRRAVKAARLEAVELRNAGRVDEVSCALCPLPKVIRPVTSVRVPGTRRRSWRCAARRSSRPVRVRASGSTPQANSSRRTRRRKWQLRTTS